MAQLLAWPLSASFAGVNSLQANGSDNPGPSPTGDSSPAGIAGRLEIVSDPTGIRGGVMRSTLYETDATTGGYRRSEIAGPKNALGEWWYRWRVMLSPDWPNLSAPFILAQLHDTPDGGDGTKAPNWLLTVLSGHWRCTVPEQTLPAEGGNLRRLGTAKCVPGVWYDCCLHVLWATGESGFREFFLDGVPMFKEFKTPTQYTDVDGPFLKLGVYDGLSAADGWVSRRAYYSDVQIWQGATSDSNGMGRARSPAPALLMLRG